jgi:Alpha/beta hydrolase family
MNDYTETWCKGGEISHAELRRGGRVRYLRVGSGPPLLLLHTVRTQLDHFQLVIPRITDAFTVYAVDFPGMGWSDIVPGASYDEPALRAAVVTVAEDLDLTDLTLAGESMGATLALTASTWARTLWVPPRMPPRRPDWPLRTGRRLSARRSAGSLAVCPRRPEPPCVSCRPSVRIRPVPSDRAFSCRAFSARSSVISRPIWWTPTTPCLPDRRPTGPR